MSFGVTHNIKKLIRGALLHDYFLYDWHKKGTSVLHGVFHPLLSLQNALRDFDLCTLEQDIIKTHMFPLTLTPPRHKESVLVCITDKACSFYETFSRRPYRKLKQSMQTAGL